MALPLPDKFCFVHDAVSEEARMALLEEVAKLAALCSPREYVYGFTKIAAVSFDRLSQPLHALVMELSGKCWCPGLEDNFCPVAVEILGYKSDGFLRPHVDHVEGEALIISLGATAHFVVGSDAVISLRNGDCIRFASDTSSAIVHGIISLDADAPPIFDTYSRISVQIRNTSKHIILGDSIS